MSVDELLGFLRDKQEQLIQKIKDGKYKPIILAIIALAAGGGFCGYQKLKEKQKEKEVAKPDPDADYVDDDEDYGYVAEDEDDLDFSDEEDNEPV